MEAAKLLERLCAQAPVASATCGLVQFLLERDFLDAVFAEGRQRGYNQQIHLQDFVEVLLPVVFGNARSLRSAYLRNQRLHAVASLKCFYEKANHIEPSVGRALVQRVGRRCQELRAALGVACPEPLPGWRLRVIDGNHLGATERRLDGLENIHSPLPGTVLPLWDYGSGLFLDVHMSEHPFDVEHATAQVLWPNLQPKDCILGDRAFCTEETFRHIQKQQASFIIRHRLPNELHALTPRRLVGRTASGTVYEERVRYCQSTLELRCVRIVLDEPTRAGETEIRLLTDLPPEVDALLIPPTYLKRRNVEDAFHELALALDTEIKTLGYPRAALFVFCLGLALYNLLQVVRGAIEVEHSRELVENLSTQMLTEEVRGHWAGIWLLWGLERYGPQPDWSLPNVVHWLRRCCRLLPVQRYRKSRRGPKRKREFQAYRRRKLTASTARVLEKRTKSRTEKRPTTSTSQKTP